MQELDDRFGVVRPPSSSSWQPGPAVRPHEGEIGLCIACRLGDARSAKLGSVMREALDNEILRLFFRQATILWVIDRDGECHLGVEETLPGFHESSALSYSAEERFARQRFSPDGLQHEKVGHPALVGCGPARIGGELLLDNNDSGEWYWVINAKSGRYGKGRSAANLENAKSMIEQLGINLFVGN